MAEWTINPATKRWQKDGVDTEYQAVGQPGATPTIDSATGDWFIDGHDTSVLARGTNGKNGLSAYELAVKNGYPYNEDKWLASLKGDPGADGKAAFSVKIGTVKTGDETTVVNSGTDENQIWDMTFKPSDLQGLAGYAVKDDVEKALDNKVDKSTLTSYYTASQMDTKLSNKADLSTIANIADKDTVATLSDKVSKLQDQVNTQAQTIVKLNDSVNTLMAKIATLSSTSSTANGK